MQNIFDDRTFKRTIKFLIFAVAITIVATVITYIVNPNFEKILEGVGSNVPDQIKESEGLTKVWLYVVNNGFKVPLQMLILSLIPIQFLYLLNIVITVTLPGILFGIALRISLKNGIGIIIAALPHYIFEVLALCLFAAVLFTLNQVVRDKIRSVFKKKESKTSLIKNVWRTIKIYTVLVLPIIIIAAFMETYIADIIFSLFE